jgi:hypothetical protein
VIINFYPATFNKIYNYNKLGSELLNAIGLKLIRDKFVCALRRWDWRTVESINIKNHFMGVNFDQKSEKMGHGKSRRFVIFWPRFLTFWTEKWAIRIYRKTGPTKSTVLGPRPPPWEFHKIYWFFTFFTVLGAFNRAGKTVTKIGIYSKPPPKSRFYSIFIENL